MVLIIMKNIYLTGTNRSVAPTELVSVFNFFYKYFAPTEQLKVRDFFSALSNKIYYKDVVRPYCHFTALFYLLSV